MAHESILIAISQIAIALTGFTGVVAILGHRNQGTWTPAERLQLRTLVETSLTAMFASLTPFILVLLINSDANAWRVANLILGSLHASNFIAFGLRTRRAPSTLGQKVMLIIGIITICAHFLAALSVVTLYELVFIGGLLQQLLVAVHNFVLLLFPIEDLS